MMQRLFSNRKRPVHWGAFPLERLKRQASAAVPPHALSERTLDLTSTDDPNSLVGALLPYLALLDRMRHGDKAPEQAPIPDDLKDRSEHLKAACYFLGVDAEQYRKGISFLCTGKVPRMRSLLRITANGLSQQCHV